MPVLQRRPCSCAGDVGDTRARIVPRIASGYRRHTVSPSPRPTPKERAVPGTQLLLYLGEEGKTPGALKITHKCLRMCEPY